MATIQNTLIMMPGDIMKSTNIKPSHIDCLEEHSKATGKSLSGLVNEALANFIHDKALWGTRRGISPKSAKALVGTRRGIKAKGV